ncbi:sugar/pyridoxal phosphate phosphatase YigL [Edwardsiella ictaluri]|uniref:sugar/pyridoxal phosphate phosphatase YigL n=1 Tax=Edwardsiella ictaluri TaxID=67780 RepID=UPI0037845C4D
MYHIVASDMDGTLLSPAHTLTPFARETLRLLTQKGVHFVFATGRHHIDIAQVRDSLGIKAFMITSNGARVHDPLGELIFSDNVDPDIARDLFSIVHDDPQILTNVYRNDDWFMNREDPAQRAFFQESVFHYHVFESAMLPADGICKVYYTCADRDRLLPLEEAINARWGDRVNVSFSLPTCLEVMAGGVSKGHALEFVAHRLGYGLQECIAFGDGMNDMEMLSMAGKGCIMADAHQRLKDLLPQMAVIGSNADDAVPHYLRKMYL